MGVWAYDGSQYKIKKIPFYRNLAFIMLYEQARLHTHRERDCVWPLAIQFSFIQVSRLIRDRCRHLSNPHHAIQLAANTPYIRRGGIDSAYNIRVYVYIHHHNIYLPAQRVAFVSYTTSTSTSLVLQISTRYIYTHNSL